MLNIIQLPYTNSSSNFYEAIVTTASDHHFSPSVRSKPKAAHHRKMSETLTVTGPDMSLDIKLRRTAYTSHVLFDDGVHEMTGL